MRAAIYLRVSTEEQVLNNSLPTQRRDCLAYSATHGMTVVATLTDDETGATTDRPGLSELRHLIRQHQVDAVIIHSVDRFHRNMVNQVLIRNEIQQSGVTIHYVRRGALQDTPEGRFTDNIEAAVAEYEREKIRERTMRGTMGKVESGKPIAAGRPPYGYRFEGERRQRTLLIDEVQASIVKEIFEWYADGGSVTEMVNDLTARRVPTWADLHPRGHQAQRLRPPGHWNHGTVYDILREELYAGVYWHFKARKRSGKITRLTNPGDWVAVPAPAIIDRAIWDKAQKRLAQGQKFSPRNAIHQYQLRGMIRCAKCGGAMTGVTRPSGISYYRCIHNHHRQPERCGASYVREKAAAGLVWEAVFKIVEPERLAQELERRQQERDSASAVTTARRADLEQQRTIVRAQLDRLLEAYRLGVTRIDILQQQTAPLNGQLDDLERRLAALETPIANPEPLEAFLSQHYQTMLEGLAGATNHPENRREFLLRLEVTVTAQQERRGTLTVSVRSLLNEEPVTLTSA